MKNFRILLLAGLFFLQSAILVTCAQNKPEEIIYTVENRNSHLISLLLKESDFESMVWNLGDAEIIQSSKNGTDGLIETATYWVSGKYVPLDQSFRIKHNILKYTTSSPENIDSLIVFSATPKTIRSIELITGVDKAKCAEYELSKFQECIFVKRYSQYASIFVISTSNTVNEDTLIEVITPFFQRVDERFVSEEP